MWDLLDANLQDAFALAYNKKRRERTERPTRISTRDLFQALARIDDRAVQGLLSALPDELFLGVNGRFRVEFRDHAVEIGRGEFVIVPRGVEHRTVAAEEAAVLVFESAATRNTGNVVDADFTAPQGVRI